MYVSLDLQNTREDSRRLKQVIYNQFNYALKKTQPELLKLAKELCYKAISQSDTYQAIIGREELLGELGIPNPQQAMQNILDTLVNQTVVDIYPLSINSRQGKTIAEIKMVLSNFGDILNLTTSEYSYTMSKDGKLKTIPWLYWLIVEGDSIVVDNYYVDFNTSGKESRTGLAVMRRDDSVGWRVPPEHSGTLRDNFITRAIENEDFAIAIYKRFLRIFTSYFYNG